MQYSENHWPYLSAKSCVIFKVIFTTLILQENLVHNCKHKIHVKAYVTEKGHYMFHDFTRQYC
jgi:hypothetical protein